MKGVTFINPIFAVRQHIISSNNVEITMDKLESDTDKKEYIILFYQYHHPVRYKKGKRK